MREAERRREGERGREEEGGRERQRGKGRVREAERKRGRVREAEIERSRGSVERDHTALSYIMHIYIKYMLIVTRVLQFHARMFVLVKAP